MAAEHLTLLELLGNVSDCSVVTMVFGDGFAPDTTVTGNVRIKVKLMTMPIFPEVCIIPLTCLCPVPPPRTDGKAIATHEDCANHGPRCSLLVLLTKDEDFPNEKSDSFKHFRQLVCTMDRRSYIHPISC